MTAGSRALTESTNLLRSGGHDLAGRDTLVFLQRRPVINDRRRRHCSCHVVAEQAGRELRRGPGASPWPVGVTCVLIQRKSKAAYCIWEVGSVSAWSAATIVCWGHRSRRHERIGETVHRRRRKDLVVSGSENKRIALERLACLKRAVAAGSLSDPTVIVERATVQGALWCFPLSVRV